MKGTPAASAARAACTSARGANIPPRPTGARITGNFSGWPSTSVVWSRAETSRMTLWRRTTCSRSATFARIVASS